MGGSRKKDDGWGIYPKLDEARFLAPEVASKTRAKKDRRRWCRGKVGVEHVVVVQETKNYRWMLTKYGPDNPRTACHWTRHHWSSRNEPHWSCRHERACATCGKIMMHSYYESIGKDCPDWVEQPTEVPCVCYRCTRT